jgi:hypothetical protein
VTLGSLSKFFPEQEIAAILETYASPGGRRRKLPRVDLVYYLVALGLFASEGCRSVLRRVLLRRDAETGEELDALCSDSAISQARSRFGWKPLQALYETLVKPIATRATIGAWFRRWRIVSLDGSTLDVSDTVRNERAFGRPGASRGKSGFPQIRFVTLLENGTHVLFGAEFGRYNTGEATLAKKVVTRLPADAICLADRNFFSYSLWMKALASGAALLWRARADLILPKLKRLSDGSYLTAIHPSRGMRGAKEIPARLITYRLGGRGEEYRLLCSILDPRKAPGIQLANLYARRWTVETVFAELKTKLRGSRVVLRSRIPAHTRQDFYGLLLAHFGVRALMHQAALDQKLEATDLSFVHAIRTIGRYLALSVSFFPSPPEEAFKISLT